jgi:hypothetical protein
MTKNKIKINRKKVPILNYSINTINDYEKLTEMFSTKNKIFIHLVEAITYGVDKNVQKVDIFKIHNSDMCITLEKSKWKDSLLEAIKFFSDESVQNYEKCIECQNIINKM